MFNIELLDLCFYVLIFLSVYSQVFFLVTFLENKNKIIPTKIFNLKNKLPTVAIIVPCWNEEKTVSKTIYSLLNLNYPKNKLSIIVIDDGSTDNTWNVILNFKKYKNVKIFKKENGGKHTALNFGISVSNSEYLGCLDADSEAEKDSLLKIISFFKKDKNIMAVAPSILVKNAKSFVQKAQVIEYLMSVYLKKMLGFLNGIHVTPGPLTIFKREVFKKIGEYKYAHSTEDMEIAYRMQINCLKIEQCHDAFVYTSTPHTIKKLFKQRVRWTYGFINNTIDYRKFILNKKYGNFSMFTLPFAVVSAFSVIYIISKMFYEFGVFVRQKIIYFQSVGFDVNFNLSNFDWFYFNTNIMLFITFLLYFLVIFSIYFGAKISTRKDLSFLNLFYFFSVFSILSPFWLLKATYNTINSKKPSWR